MTYESKIIIGEKIEKDGELYGFTPFAKFYCGKCAFIKNSSEFFNAFNTEMAYHKNGAFGAYLEEGIYNDYYGDGQKYCEIPKLIEVLEKLKGEHRKLDAVLGFLKIIDQSKFDNLIAIHFGYWVLGLLSLKSPYLAFNANAEIKNKG